MLVQDERGRFAGKAGGPDFLDNLTCFREVVRDPDGLCAVAFAVNDFPLRGNFGSCRLRDSQGTEANEKIVGLIAFLPSRIEDRNIGSIGPSSLSPVIDPSGHRALSGVRCGFTVHEHGARAVHDAICQPREINRHGWSRVCALASNALVSGRDTLAHLREHGIRQLLAVRREIRLRSAFQVSGKHRRGDVHACFHPSNFPPPSHGRHAAIARLNEQRRRVGFSSGIPSGMARRDEREQTETTDRKAGTSGL
jgi:hypothetical protein